MGKILWVFFLSVSTTLQAQDLLKGVIRDLDTQKPVPFVLIQSSDGESYFSDVNGKFENLPSDTYTLSAIGYHSIKVEFPEGSFFSTIQMFSLPHKERLEKIEDSRIRGAEIIDKVIKSKQYNNPEKQLKDFQFKSYNKLKVTAHLDSLKGDIDTLIQVRRGKEHIKIDSTNYKFKRLIEKQHLFLTEKVSLFQFSGGEMKETVLGTQMSGLEKPIYEIIAFNLQSMSLYNNRYELLERSYVSPIADRARGDYTYHLVDSIVMGERMVWVLHFGNHKKKDSKGLEGLLFIDKQTFAVVKAITRIRGILDITGIHEFVYIPEKGLWFPLVREFSIVKGKNDDPVKILGGTIHFEGDWDDSWQERKKDPSDYSYLVSRSVFFDYKYDIPIVVENPEIYLEIPEEAIRREEAFWQQYRVDPLDSKEQKTYVAMDSLLKKEKIEKRIFLGRKLVNGYFPVGFFDFDVRYLISFNNYEGFRFGIGGVTNDAFSKAYRLEGYTAYGLKDNTLKYNLGGAARLDVFSNTWFGASYTEDVREIASTSFYIDKRTFKLYDPRPFNVSTFYTHKSARVFMETRALPKSEGIWQMNYSKIIPQFGYSFLANEQEYASFDITTTSFSIQWNPFSDFMQTPDGRFEIEKRFPRFTFQVTKTVRDIASNDFDFAKFDFRGEYEKKYLNGHYSSVLLQAGIAFGDVPITHLYSISPNNLTNDRFWQRITFASKNGFETMYFNEFFSSRYIMMQFKHGLNRVSLFRQVKPSVVLVTRMALGGMEKPEQHLGIDYKTLEDGFIESGVEFNQIFKGFGFTTFYRYGPNQLSRFEDNISLKISFVLDIGL